MPRNNQDVTDKDHDLLIRIDEQIKLLLQRLTAVELALSDNKSLYENLNLRTTKIEKDVYGDKFVDGIVVKVEKHDKLLTKAMVCFTIAGVVIDFLFNFFIKGSN